MVICSGMLLSLNRTLASSTGCTVKHWMSAGVKEPQGLRGWGCRGEGMGGVREVLRDRVGMRAQGAARPARAHAARIHCPGEPVMSGPGGDVVCSFSALGKGLSSRISKSSRRSYSLPR